MERPAPDTETPAAGRADLHAEVCVATFRRPDMLRRLLASLAAMPPVPGRPFGVILVDNAPEASARDVARQFAQSLPLIYAHEPAPGVAHARNRALSLAGAPFVAFVDDDEEVAPGWLAALVDTAEKFSADVVFGPVPSRLPEAAPAWLRASGLFERRRSATGSPRATGGAGNVLLRRSILARAGRGFDPAFSGGGEDTEFFHHLHRLGARMVWCDEAVAVETVPPERARLAWLWRRNRLAGRIYARVYLLALPAPARAGELLRCALGLALCAPLTLFALILGRHAAARQLMRLARCLGRLEVLARPGEAAASLPGRAA